MVQGGRALDETSVVAGLPEVGTGGSVEMVDAAGGGTQMAGTARAPDHL